MRPFLLALLVSLPLAQPALARWQVTSEFQLQLTESIFDKIVDDFWQSVQGTQKAGPNNLSFSAGATRIQANGVNVAVDYSFAKPQRVSANQREWQLTSQNLSARLTADQLLITQHQVISSNGLVFETDITVECRNIALTLPPGNAKVTAMLQAVVAQNQVQLSMPSYHADWPSGSWQVESLNCPQLANIKGAIQDQIVSFLSSFQNVDQQVGSALNQLFVDWSKQASLLLLSEHELPSPSDYLKIYYEPRLAKENNGNGLILGGVIRFDYPYVSPNQDVNQEFKLPEGAQVNSPNSPQLIIPFAAVRSLLMGEYFAGKLEYTLRASEIAGFQTLMQSRFKQFFGWPDLMNFPKDTPFLFQFLPMGAPSLDNARAGAAAGTITTDLDFPVSVRMFAPLKGLYTPYVEFRTRLNGPTSLSLQKDGKVHFQITASDQPVTYAFSKQYLQEYSPNESIAVKTIASATRDALNADGLNLTFPSITVGKQLALLPSSWTLQKNSVLQVNFDAGTTPVATPPAQVTNVKTSNGKVLKVKSARSKRR